MIIHILKNSINMKKKENILLLIQSFITYFLIILILNMINSTNNKVDQLELATRTLYKVTDNFILEYEKQFFKQQDNVEILKKLYEWEKQNEQFIYIIANQQNVGKDKEYFPKIFEIGYDAGQETLGTYKSLQVNSNFLTHFSVSTSDGRLFLEKDYSSNNEILPILLGNDYKIYCKLNQNITLYYLGKEFTCEIVGFLEKDSYYNNGYDIKSLDRYIILPSIEMNLNTLPLNAEEKSFELKLFLDKCAGYLYSDCSGAYLQNLINSKCYDLDIQPYSIEGVFSFYPTMWGLEGESLLNLMILFVGIILVSSVLCMSINMSSKIIFFKKYYAIIIANGVEIKKIFWAVALEILLMNMLPLILAMLLATLILGQLPIIHMLIICIAIFILSYIYPFSILSRIQISKVLRGDD